MLAYLKNGASVALDFDDYYIQEEWFGADDTLAFTLPASHPQLPDMMCQLSLTDKESGQAFLITNIDEGDVKAKIDLDEFREQMFLSYTNSSATAMATAQQMLPSGWSVQDFSGSTARRTIEAEGATALEILQKLPDTYGIAVRFDRKTKRVLLRNPDNMAPSGTYLTEELNLRKRPVRSQSSEGFATRLYAVGKDGVTFASINGGKNYVENHEYSDRVISAYWKDERYTDPQSLLDDAKKKLSDMAKPAQSYECDVADLAKIDPARFGHLSMEMYQAVTLLDAERGTRLAHRVVQYKRYPHYPEKNVVTLSTLPGTISGKVEQSYQAVTNPNSSFQQQLAANLQGVAQTIVGAKGGSVKFIQDEKGKPTGILFMDTDNEATAKNIIRINHMGLAFSNNGSSGPWTQAITIDGGLANQWIETWQLTASIIVAGIRQSRDGKSFWNLDTGELNLNGVFTSLKGRMKAVLDGGSLSYYIDDALALDLDIGDDPLSKVLLRLNGDRTKCQLQANAVHIITQDGKILGRMGVSEGLDGNLNGNLYISRDGDAFHGVNLVSDKIMCGIYLNGYPFAMSSESDPKPNVICKSIQFDEYKDKKVSVEYNAAIGKNIFVLE